MKMHRNGVLRSLLTVTLALIGGMVTSAPVDAQSLAQELDRERMVQFTRAHLAVNDARDEFHGAVARVHDEEGRIRAREEVEAAIAAILEEAEMTREEFDEITLMISLDGDLRTMFEEIMVELEEEGTEG